MTNIPISSGDAEYTKIRQLIICCLLTVCFVKRLVCLDAHYSEHQGLMGFKTDYHHHWLFIFIFYVSGTCDLLFTVEGGHVDMEIKYRV